MTTWLKLINFLFIFSGETVQLTNVVMYARQADVKILTEFDHLNSSNTI